MKINRFHVFIIAFIGLTVIVLNACQKNDETPPVITLNGASTIYVTLNTDYADPGAIVSDNKSVTNVDVYSNLSHSNPNIKRTGIYIINYWATDESGYKGFAARTVIVKNDADFLAYNYVVQDTANGVPYYYLQTISTDTSINNRIHFSSFGNYNNNTDIYADFKAGTDTLTLPLQTGSDIGLVLENHQFSGTAIVDGQNFVLNYTDKNLAQGTTSTGVAHYIKQ